jgi:hypothetical protein
MLNIVQWPPFNPLIRDPHKNKDAKGEVPLSAIAVQLLWKKLYPFSARASSVFWILCFLDFSGHCCKKKHNTACYLKSYGI